MARGKNNEQKQNAKTVRHRQIKDGDNQTKAKKSDAAVEDPSKTVQKGRKRKTSSGKRGKRVQKDTKPVAVRAKNKRIAKWEDAEHLILLEGWARDGLTMEQIASNMGICKDTLYRWAHESTYISDAIKKGKEVADYAMESALYASGLAGNVVAQIFWLKNRKPDKWKDKVEQEIDLDADTSGVIVLAPVLEKNEEPTKENNMGTPAETN